MKEKAQHKPKKTSSLKIEGKKEEKKVGGY